MLLSVLCEDCGLRKKNRIIGCEKTVRGLLITVQTPNDQFHRELYCGYTEREALKLARNTDFDRRAGLLFPRSTQPHRR